MCHKHIVSYTYVSWRILSGSVNTDSPKINMFRILLMRSLLTPVKCAPYYHLQMHSLSSAFLLSTTDEVFAKCAPYHRLLMCSLLPLVLASHSTWTPRKYVCRATRVLFTCSTYQRVATTRNPGMHFFHLLLNPPLASISK